MKKGFHLGQSEFDALMDLLSDDREEAGDIYERIRSGLFRFFRYKGCSDPVDLVDETFDRVAARTHKFDPSLSLKPEKYFYGFAALIAKEHLRKMARQSTLSGAESNSQDLFNGPAYKESDLRRLQDCLTGLDEEDRKLITEYHSLDGQERIDLRNKICERLNYTFTALYARVSRIRKRLKACMEDRDKNKL